jgi:diaminopropionate ammonia-lyase
VKHQPRPRTSVQGARDVEVFTNPLADPEKPYDDALRAIVSLEKHVEARNAITRWPGYRRTPLHSLGGFAARAGVRSVWYKDEGARFDVGSFKALGGAYGVQKVLERFVLERTGVAPATEDLLTGRHRDVSASLTVATASDGNHGRAVAWGAKLFGCRAVVYLPAAVSRHREDAIRGFGAEVVRVSGNYDDAVHAVQRDAGEQGFIVVSDTSYHGYTAIPSEVMQGYTVLVAEILEQLPPIARLTHVFLQAGVGAFAASVIAHLWETLGSKRPRLVIVEPERAACLLASAKAGQPVVVPGEHDTIMAGLAAGEVSLLGWSILSPATHAFMTVPDDDAALVMRALARPASGDPAIVAGESAVAGLAGLRRVASDAESRTRLGIDESSEVLVIGTEGATDPEVYRSIVG